MSDPSKPDVTDRLQQAIVEYQAAVDQGRRPGREQFLQRYADVAAELQDWLTLTQEREQTGAAAPDLLTPPHSADADTISLADFVPPRLPVSARMPDLSADYEDVQVLRQGGMGVVYRARQRDLNRTVALKFILPRGQTSAEERQRFRVEAEALARLKHPNIVTVYGTSQQDDHPYLIMEYVDGQSLRDVLVESPLAPRRAARIVLAVAEAVQEAHQQGILHRDLKPSNILLDHQDQPHVTDFGLARFVDRCDDLTVTGQVLGTPGYMSPEQAMGTADVDHLTDVYSLGALLYTTLVGRPPFQADSTTGTLLLVQQEIPPSVLTLAPGTPRDLNTICMKCLRKPRHQRYSSAAEVAADLRSFLDNRPVQARPVSLLEQGSRWFQRNRATGTALLLAMLFAVLGLAGLSLHVSSVNTLNETLAGKNDVLQTTLHQMEQLRSQEQAAALRSAEMRYASDMRLAMDAWRSGFPRQAAILLDAQIPDPGQPDVRCFAWHYLTQLTPRPMWENSTSDSPCYSVTSSPDDQYCVVAGGDGKIRVLDAATGQDVRQWDSQQQEVNSLTFHPDGHQLASAGDDGSVCLWAWPEGTLVERLPGTSEHRIYGVQFTPDGQHLYLCGEQGELKCRNLVAGTWQSIQHPDYEGHNLESLRISQDGSRLVTARHDGHISVWNHADQGWVRHLAPHSAPATVATFLPSGAHVISGDKTGGLTIHRADQGKPLARFRRPDGIQNLACSNNGLIAVSDRGGAVTLWRFAPKELSADAAPAPVSGWKVDDDRIYGLGFSNRGQSLMTGSRSGRIASWSTGTAQPSSSLDPVGKKWVPYNSHPVEVSPGNFVAISKGTLVLLDCLRSVAENWETSQGLTDLSEEKLSYTMTADREVLVACTAKRELLVRRPHQPLARIPDVQFEQLLVSPDRRFVLGHTRRVLTQVDLHSLAMKQLADNISCFTFSPDGRRIWVGEHVTHQLVCRSWPEWEEQLRVNAHHTTITDASVSPDGRQLATCGDDRRLVLFDVQSGELLWEVAGLSAMPCDIAWSPDQRTLSVAFRGGAVRLYQAATGRELYQLSSTYAHQHRTTTVFSADGQQLLLTVNPVDFQIFRADRPMSDGAPASAVREH